MKNLFLFVVLATSASYASAQQARLDPADPAAPVPQTRYDSPFSGYNSYREQDLAVWREVNDEVARIGGHVKMFGGAGQASHGGAKPGPAKPSSGQPAAKKDQPAGQPPARGAPQGSRQGH